MSRIKDLVENKNYDGFSLVNLLNEELDFDEDEAPILFKHSTYYDNDSFINAMKLKKDSFIVISLNCQSLRAKFNQLKVYLELFQRNNISISAICLQETWLSDQDDVSLLQLEGYTLISKGKSCSAHGGVAIYLHNRFKYSVISFPQSNVWDGLAIKVNEDISRTGTITQKNIILGNIYRPPRQNVENIKTFSKEVVQLFNVLQHYKQVVIAGDFNLDLLKIKENNHVNDFFETLIANSYVPKITLPTRLTESNGTLIDNCLVKISDNFSKSLAGILLQNLSDHSPYFIAIDNLITHPNSFKYIQISTKTDESVSKFKQYLGTVNYQNLFSSNPNDTDPNQNYNKLNETITKGMSKFFPTKTVKFNRYKHRKCPWITKGILISIKYRDSLYKQLKSTPVLDAVYPARKINLQTYCRILKRSIRQAKTKYYYSCFEKFKGDARKTWNAIKQIINKTSQKKEFPNYFEINDNKVTDMKIIANEFNNFFVNVGPKLAEKIDTPNNSSYTDYLGNQINKKFEFKSVSSDEVRKIIDGLKSKTSWGHDGISSKFLKQIKNEILEPVTLIINQSILHGVFPDKLKIAKIVPLHKAGSVHSFNNYRPVSILPSIAKVFEKILFNQISVYFNENKLFYPSQYGFRSQHSTELAAIEFIDRVTFELDHGHTPLSIFLDLSKAFDTIDHDILLSKLRHYGFQNKSLDLIATYLHNRYQYVQLDDYKSDSLVIKTGVPQGSVLGPLLFLIYLNDMTTIKSCFHPILYADDSTLMTTLKTQQNRTNNINAELEKFNKWLKLNKLSLNCTKSKAMLFHMPQKQVTFPDIMINNSKIEFVDCFNYLGILVDKNLSWNSHVNDRSLKITKVVGMLNKLKHFLPPKILLDIYNSLIVPHLNYGALLWEKCSDNLFKLQKKAIRSITLSRYNAHTCPLFKKLGLLKCKDICALHAFKFCFKLENKMLPGYFQSGIFKKTIETQTHDYDLRNSNIYTVPQVKHEFAKRTIYYKIPDIINNMDESIRQKIYTQSFIGFKTDVKKIMIESYPTECLIEDCYNCNRT